VKTEYQYDPETFRLISLKTQRKADGAMLQDLNYTYDPVGNITTIQDDAQQTIYFDGQVVNPSTKYQYDPLYRLIQAEGREHIGQTTSRHQRRIQVQSLSMIQMTGRDAIWHIRIKGKRCGTIPRRMSTMGWEIFWR
jgi:hypothetical protein